MREEFLRMLDSLNENLIIMSNLVENAIAFSVEALETQQTYSCRRVYDLEKQINEKEKFIEDLCSKIIIRQQPVAIDFKKVKAAQKMIIDLERIGDNAKDIAEIAERLSTMEKIKDYTLIPKMADETVKMVKLSLNAYINDDISAIHNLGETDDIVDALFVNVKDQISQIVLKNPKSIDTALDILMIAKYLEKISDHAVSIAGHVESLAK